MKSVRWAATDAGKGAGAQSNEASAQADKDVAPPATADEEAQSLKEKVKMGEVRRLVQLARPERKTIGLAIGLVRRSSPSRPIILGAAC